MRNILILTIELAFFAITNTCFAAWDCDVRTTNQTGHIQQKQSASFTKIDDLDFDFKKDDEVTGDGFIIYTTKYSRIKFFSNYFLVDDSQPKIAASHYTPRGWVNLECNRKQHWQS